MIQIIDFKDEHDKHALELFYRSVFHNRGEFEYARLPSWSHRYSLEEHSIKLLALVDEKIVGSLGLMSYYGYVNGKKQKIGFFVDNCVLPEHHPRYDEIMSKLFIELEKRAKKEGVDVIFGWEYLHHADSHNGVYQNRGYSRIDGINWFGGGTKHVDMFSIDGFNLSIFWRVALRLMGYKHRVREALLAPLTHERIREMGKSDIAQVVLLLNEQNKRLEFSPRYTDASLKKTMLKYRARGIVAEINGGIAGVMIYFVSPWSGWMYGKPTYTKKHGFFLIKHPLEFAVIPQHAERIAAHLIFHTMKERGRYMYIVDIFDRRVSWMKKAFFDTGADELPYDFGVVFFKNLKSKKDRIHGPVYVPTNLVISPYTAKDY